MGRRSDPHWRDRAASELAGSVLSGRRLDGRVLVVDDPEEAAAEAARSMGVEVVRWSRMDRPGGPMGRPWPPEGPFSAALVRLPRSRDALDFSLHAAASELAPGAMVLIYGAKDEGIASTPRHVEPLLGPVVTRSTARRCRVLEGHWVGPKLHERGFTLAEWRSVRPVDLGRGPVEWVSYPGTFAKGGVDPGTDLLLRHLPVLPDRARVLDFAAGTGLLAAALRPDGAGPEVVLVEPDALAREAARENVPGAVFGPLDGWWEEEPFDAIVSNPPYHRGKAETLEVIEGLVARAPDALREGGELRMVVQRRLPLEELLERAFGDVQVLGDEGPYRVWCAAHP